jgi:hypothetical protein
VSGEVKDVAVGLAVVAAGVALIALRRPLARLMVEAWQSLGAQDGPELRKLAQAALGFLGVVGIGFGIVALVAALSA